MITGRMPFEGQTTADVIASILRTEPAATTEFVPDLPPEMEKIVSKALSKDRQQRYQTSEQLLTDLRAVRRTQDLQTEHAETVPKPRQFWGTRFGWASLALLIFTLTLATAVSLWLVTRSREGEQSASFSSVRFAELYSWKSERGEAMLDARFSHDGTRIAFTALNHGWQTIWVKQTTNEAEPIPITQEKSDNYWPIWSPDDQQIAFMSRRNNETGIWLVPAAGGGPTLLKIVNAAQTERTRSWSKDGSTIYYELDNNLHSLDVASKTTKQITHLPAMQSNRQFSISPDQEKIAYVGNKDGQFDVWVASMKGSDTIQVTNDPAEDRYPIWHPDGKRIIYTSNRGGAYQVCVGYLDAQKPVQVTVGGADHVIADVSNDGSKLLDVGARHDSNIFRVGADGSRESEITSGISLNLWPAVSPDGKTIAYQSTNAIGKLYSSSIMIRPTSGGQQQQIASDGFNVSWSRDSRRVAYLSQSGDEVNIFSVGIAGEDEKQLTRGGIVYSGYSLLPSNLIGQDFSWSPRDGSKIVYCSRKSGQPNVWTINADGSEETQITANSDRKLTLSTPFWSADGKSIAYLSNMSLPEVGKEVWSVWLAEQGRSQMILQATSFLRLVGWSDSRDELIVAIGEDHTDDPSSPMSVALLAVTPGGGRRAIVSLKSIYVLTVQLSPDSQTIAFISDQDGADNLWLVPVAGGVARKVTVNADAKLYLSSPAWSPDRRTMYYSKHASWGVISMIDNFR
jgi:TolB protein